MGTPLFDAIVAVAAPSGDPFSGGCRGSSLLEESFRLALLFLLGWDRLFWWRLLLRDFWSDPVVEEDVLEKSELLFGGEAANAKVGATGTSLLLPCCWKEEVQRPLVVVRLIRRVQLRAAMVLERAVRAACAIPKNHTGAAIVTTTAPPPPPLLLLRR